MRVTEVAVESGARGGAGSALVPVPGTPTVLMARQDGSPRPALLALDLDTMSTARTGSRSPGDLRDAALGPDGAGWVAGLHGLGRLEAGSPPRLEVVAVARLPRYPGRVTRVGPGLLSVGNPYWTTSVLVDEQTLSLAGRLRVPQVEHAVPDGSGVTLLDVRHGWVGRLDLRTRRAVRTGSMVAGTWSARVGDSLVVLAGRRLLRVALAAPAAEPAVLVEALPAASAPGWELAGAGEDGTVVLTHRDVVLVLGPGGPPQRVETRHHVSAAAYLPERRTVVAALHRQPADPSGQLLTVVELDD